MVGRRCNFPLHMYAFYFACSLISACFQRGLAGTCLVYKIAGALAQSGGTLDQVYDMAQWVSSRVATIGVGLEHCHVCFLTIITTELPDNVNNNKIGPRDSCQ